MLQKGLGAGAALQQRRGLAVAAEQQPRPLGAVQPLVSRHGDKCRPQFTQGDGQHPRRLGGVQHEGYASFSAGCGDALHRQTVAEHVGDMGADRRVRTGIQRLLKLRQHHLRPKERCVHHRQLHVGDTVERPCHRVMLIPGDDDPAPRLYQRFDGDVQPVGGVGGEHYPCRVVYAEQLRRQTAALKIRLLRQPRGGIAAPPRRTHGRHRIVHSTAHTLRLLQRCRTGVQIDHTSTSLYPCPCRRNTRRGANPRPRSNSAASSAARRPCIRST